MCAGGQNELLGEKKVIGVFKVSKRSGAGWKGTEGVVDPEYISQSVNLFSPPGI